MVIVPAGAQKSESTGFCLSQRTIEVGISCEFASGRD